MNGEATAIIPARLGSTRFPRKALADDTGKALVVHVCEQAAMAESIDRVVVACDAEEIASAVRRAGFESILTDPAHENGTSRLGEAARSLGLADEHVVVNVQGDEPEIERHVIDGAARAVEQSPVGTVASPFGIDEDPANPNIVKCVAAGVIADSGIGRALYFSRALVPHDRDGVGIAPPLKHVGIYAYRVGTLRQYAELAPTPLERTECLEQLRWLEHGFEVGVAVRESTQHGIDTPEQYAAFVQRWNAANR